MRCGITGLRPTYGRVPRTGAMTLCWSLDKLGPMTRGVEDAMLVLQAISGPDPGDIASVPTHLSFDAGASAKGLRVGYIARWMNESPATDVDRAALETARKIGMTPVAVTLPDWPYGSLNLILFAEAAAAFEDLTLNGKLKDLKEQVADAWPNTFRQARFLSAVDFVQADRLRRSVAQEMARVFSQVDVLLAPSLRDEMLTHRQLHRVSVADIARGLYRSRRSAQRLGAGQGSPAAKVLTAAARAARGHAHRKALRRRDARERGSCARTCAECRHRAPAGFLSVGKWLFTCDDDRDKPGILPQISPAAWDDADRIRERFLHAKPFRHVAIEDFFDADFAQRLLDEFPSFDKHLAIAESGQAGGKAVNTKIATIGPAYQELYALLSSAPFLDYVSRLSGVEDLILDPAMYGGGTHENLHGQELDPHVDFNYDQTNRLHRRLNLIVYLNQGWRSEWGGGIEVHSNPRHPDENQIQTWAPIFNRAIMFETNEYSWHGFPKIELPEDRRTLSRKSISIYLYTKDRPANEIAPTHATFYVQRPLPARFAPGYKLGADDISELRRLLARRDRWIEFYQKMELDNSRNTAGLHGYIAHHREERQGPADGLHQAGGNSGRFLPRPLGHAVTQGPSRPSGARCPTHAEGFSARGFRAGHHQNPGERGGSGPGRGGCGIVRHPCPFTDAADGSVRF